MPLAITSIIMLITELKTETAVEKLYSKFSRPRLYTNVLITSDVSYMSEDCIRSTFSEPRLIIRPTLSSNMIIIVGAMAGTDICRIC